MLKPCSRIFNIAMRRRNNDFQLAGTKRQCGNLKQFFRCQDPPNQKDPTLPEGSPLLPLNIHQDRTLWQSSGIALLSCITSRPGENGCFSETKSKSSTSTLVYSIFFNRVSKSPLSDFNRLLFMTFKAVKSNHTFTIYLRNIQFVDRKFHFSFVLKFPPFHLVHSILIKYVAILDPV